jgi:hypothetical protein
LFCFRFGGLGLFGAKGTFWSSKVFHKKGGFELWTFKNYLLKIIEKHFGRTNVRTFSERLVSYM